MLSSEFDRPAQFMLQRYGHDAERVAASWAMALETEGFAVPAQVWWAVATSLRGQTRVLTAAT